MTDKKGTLSNPESTVLNAHVGSRKRIEVSKIYGYKENMEGYLADRSMAFGGWSEFSCPDTCERHGCTEPGLHITISLVDLISISLISGRRVSDLFRTDCKLGFDPLTDLGPWIGRVNVELKKPCCFLDGRLCDVYLGRPMACALFPEAHFVLGQGEALLKKEIFQKFPCLQRPCSIPPRREEMLFHLLEMTSREVFLSDLYLFGFSPLVIDLKNLAGEGLEGVPLSQDGKMSLPHHRIESLLTQKLCSGPFWQEVETKVDQLDQTEGMEGFMRLKPLTDQMLKQGQGETCQRVYPFDGHRLQPIRLGR